MLKFHLKTPFLRHQLPALAIKKIIQHHLDLASNLQHLNKTKGISNAVHRGSQQKSAGGCVAMKLLEQP